MGEIDRELRRKLARVLRRAGLRAHPNQGKPGHVPEKTWFGSGTDILGQYGYLADEPVRAGTNPASGEARLVWVIPDFQAGAGGHATIFRMVHLLERAGFGRQAIWIVPPHRWRNAEDARAAIARWYQPVAADVHVAAAGLPGAAVAMATSWQTAYWLRRLEGVRHKAYFVQDFEPAFHPAGTEYCLAENTYGFGFHGITAGGWLKEQVARYGMRADAFGFSCDHDIYRPGKAQEPRSGNRVFFYARPSTPRRAFELGVAALERLSHRVPELAVTFAGWDVSGYRFPFRNRNEGVVTPRRLAELYRECGVGLVLSLTNLSLMPLEMMACKLPVVINRGANNEWLLPPDAVQFCDLDPNRIADALGTVLSDRQIAGRLAETGHELARRTDWAVEAGKIADALARLEKQA